MNIELESLLKKATGALNVGPFHKLQQLWSGYGKLERVELQGSELASVIIKTMAPPKETKHPRGWTGKKSHQRKMKSYEVERNWYQHYSYLCDENCRVAKWLGTHLGENYQVLILEDLTGAGFTQVKKQVAWIEFAACVRWLAWFHARHLQQPPEKLWQQGSYWHLATRPDELEKLDDLELKKAAPALDHLLYRTVPQTLIHGDAKLANFCFSEDGKKAAAVDFQYVGAGCGMQDLSLLTGSCFDGEQCHSFEENILNLYFEELEKALIQYDSTFNRQKIEESWRPLYHIAWVDFQRFLKGWCPDHWKINSYTESLIKKVLGQIKGQP